MDFNDSHKQEINTRLPFGVSKVEIIGFNVDKTPSGSEFIEVGFVTEEGAEDKARLYFTDKAAKFSFNTCRGILLHNTPETQKEKAKSIIDAVPNHEKLAELMTQKLIGKEAWATKYLDPNRTYEKDGQTYQSVNVNIFAYEPKLNESLMPKGKPGESVAQAASAVFGTEEPAKEGDVPFKNGGSQASDWA